MHYVMLIHSNEVMYIVSPLTELLSLLLCSYDHHLKCHSPISNKSSTLSLLLLFV